MKLFTLTSCSVNCAHVVIVVQVVKQMEANSSPGKIDDDDNKNRKRDGLFFKQIFLNIPQIIMHMNNGMIAGYSAILLPQLENEESALRPSKSQESWIASLVPLLMALACIFSGLSMDRFGRKTTIMMASVLAAIGWTIIYFCQNISTLLIGRIITGLAVGYSGVCMSSFIGEINHPKYRGFFLNAIYLGIAMGTLIVHFLGMVFSWRIVALISILFPCSTLTGMIFIPESHVWYVNRNKLEKAERCFAWFRGSGEEAKAEWDKLIYEKLQLPVRSVTFFRLVEKCKSQRFIRPFLLSILLFVLSQTTGNNAVVFYSVAIMQRTVDGIDKYTSTLVVDILRVFMLVLACVLIKKFKVRKLAMISGIGTSTSLFLLALFAHLAAKYTENKFYGIIPLFCFISYIVFICIGLLPLAWALMGEILPPETKGVGGGISATINFLVFFIVVKTNPALMESVGPSGTFATYGLCTTIGTILLYFFLPETRGKTLEEIQEYFTSRPKNLNQTLDEGEELKFIKS